MQKDYATLLHSSRTRNQKIATNTLIFFIRAFVAILFNLS